MLARTWRWGDPRALWMGTQGGGTQDGGPSKNQSKLPRHPASLLLGTCPQKGKAGGWVGICMPTFTRHCSHRQAVEGDNPSVQRKDGYVKCGQQTTAVPESLKGRTF